MSNSIDSIDVNSGFPGPEFLLDLQVLSGATSLETPYIEEQMDFQATNSLNENWVSDESL